MTRTISALTIIFILSACSNLHIEKRRYNKGLHVSFTKRVQPNKKVITKPVCILGEENRIKYKKPIETVIESQHTCNKEITSFKDSTFPEKTDSSLVEKENFNGTVLSHNSSPIRSVIKHSKLISFSEKKSKSELKSNVNPRASGLWYFSILAILSLIFFDKKRSYLIGAWAAANVSRARITIAGLYTLGFSSSFLIGNIWHPKIEEWMTLVPLTLMGTTVLIHGAKISRSNNGKKVSYALVNFSSFYGTFALGSQLNTNLLLDPELHNGQETGEAVFVTILLILCMIIAIIGIVLLACTITCNGYGLLALLFLIGSGYLILFLGSWAILSVNRRKANKVENLKLAALIGLFGAIAGGVLGLMWY